MAVTAKPENAGMEPDSCKPQGQIISVKQKDAEMPSIGMMKEKVVDKNPGGECYWRTDTQFIFLGLYYGTMKQAAGKHPGKWPYSIFCLTNKV